uniref:RRM domain-containing protein n=1 Tax=Romanomermis culicivorax TaxID=13658 RepID=A0A915IR11_ROMCU
MKMKKVKAPNVKPITGNEENSSKVDQNFVEEKCKEAETSVSAEEQETHRKGKKRSLKYAKASVQNSDEEVDSEGNVAKRKKLGSYNEKMSDDELKRTIFIGNLPIGITRKDVQKLFSPCGAIESSRIRSIVLSKDKMWKRVAAIKNEMSSEFKDSIHAYVKFKDVASVEKALE